MFLVDGYNVIRRTPALANAEEKGSLASGRSALVAAIVASGILRSHRVIVVFDGGPGAAPFEPSPHRMLQVRFSIPPESADDTILTLLEDAKSRQAIDDVTVITADRDLSWRVSSLGAKVMAPDSWSGLSRPRRSRTSPVPLEGSEKPRATASDVDYWLEVFGNAEDE